MQVRSRIAPTPSGYLHLGNAFDFLLAWLLTGRANGHLLLRIDDLDGPRVRDTFIQDIFDTLAWLKLDFEEGPRSISDLKDQWSQQLRISRYENLLEQLVQTGRIYACRCSRKDLAQSGAAGCTCAGQHYSLNEKEVAWRFKTSMEDDVILHDLKLGSKKVNVHACQPNFVVRRKEGWPAYHIASLSDDEAWQMNLIVRGQDLWESSAVQMLLAQCLDMVYFTKANFYHHPLLLSSAGAKLSKSEGAGSLKEMRQQGITSAEVYRQFCIWTGLPELADDAAGLLESGQKLF